MHNLMTKDAIIMNELILDKKVYEFALMILEEFVIIYSL